MRLVSWAAVTLLAMCLCGCGAKNEQTGNGPESGGASSKAGAPTAAKGTIGVSVLTMTNPFFKTIADTITAEAVTHGYETTITSGEFDVAKQQNQVKDFIVAGCSAIVLCPCDSRSIGPAIAEANAAGIPVFTADIACLAEGVDVVSHVASDNLGGGRLAAEAMIEAMGEAGGEVVVLDFKQAESCLLRVQGFKEVLDAHNADHPEQVVEIVAELPGDGKKDQGFKCTEDALQAHANLAGIFAINDPSALGARAALEKAGKADEIVIVGFDGQIDGKQAIKEGKIYADPVQFPERIAAMTVDSIVRYFAGDEVATEQLIPCELYRQADGEADPSLQ
ncbi:sugar ABC transporter substrate-binding protein [bacterium]|jgi:ribose transport system substrate-binding protein|nr:sugar ABC transporter substrate-binding protein [bacterium]